MSSPPTFKTGEFIIGDWKFERFEPANDDELREVHIVATSEQGESQTKVVQLFHPNIFGLDVEDAATINQAVEEMITSLGLSDL